MYIENYLNGETPNGKLRMYDVNYIHTNLPKDNTVLNIIKITKEEWRAVKDFPHLYQVSNLGRIRNYRGRVLKTWRNNNNYECIKFTVDNKGIHKLVHRLVSEVFLIPTTIKNAEVNHKDGNKYNNVVTNLQWVTSSENKFHAFDCGLKSIESCKSTLGKKHKSTDSIYHNVSFDKVRNKWIASIRHNGKTHMQKRFVNEIDAALHVNYVIDCLGLTDRPYNVIL